MKNDTLLEIVLRKKIAVTRIMETKKDIMLMLQRMMNLHRREPDMKVKILQARMNFFLFLLSRETLLMKVMIGL